MLFTLESLDSPLDAAEVLVRSVEKLNQHAITPQEVKFLVQSGRVIRQSIVEMRETFVGAISAGVLLTPPEDESSSATARLAPLGSNIQRMLVKLKSSALPAYVQELVNEMEAFAREMSESDRLLNDFWAAVNASGKPAPLDRIREREEELSRGEMRKAEKGMLRRPG